MARNSYYEQSDPFQESSASFVVPIQTSSSSQGQHNLALGTSSLSLQHSPSSTRNYRYSNSVEAGDYRHQAPSPASSTSYASAQSGGFDDNASTGSGQRQSRQFTRQPSSGQLSGGGSSGRTSATGGVSRSMSIGGAGGSRAGSSNRMAYSPNPQTDAVMSSPTWTSPRIDSLAADTSSQHQPANNAQQHYRASPSSSSSTLPPQPGLMRRGLSYDGGFSSPSRQLQQQAPPPLQTSSLLPTSYSGRAPPSAPYSPMTGVQTSPYLGSKSPNLPSASSSLTHFQQQQSTGTGPPPGGGGAGSSTDHNRHASYSPSHYAANSSNANSGPPPPPSSSSHYLPSATSASSFYAHHIPSSGPAPLATSDLSNLPPSSRTPAHQPQAQQYYQSQQYFDSTLKRSSASTAAPPPPPAQAATNSAGMNAAAMYYAGGQDLRLAGATSTAAGGGGGAAGSSSSRRGNSSKGLRRVRDPREIKRVVNAQPAGRRADPAGGFVSVRFLPSRSFRGVGRWGARELTCGSVEFSPFQPLKALTTHLPQTYHLVNPSFRYETSLNPRRVLTKPSKPATNEGFDNEDSDYILYVNDVLGPEDKDR
jgi:dual specificity protein kinase YAK1